MLKIHVTFEDETGALPVRYFVNPPAHPNLVEVTNAQLGLCARDFEIEVVKPALELLGRSLRLARLQIIGELAPLASEPSAAVAKPPAD